MVLEWLVQNWTWTLFFILFAAGLVLMRRLPNVQIIGKVLFKINSTRGIDFMDRVGRKYSGFWTLIGDLALILLFGGLGTAYVTNNRGKKGRGIILASLTFFTLFVYLGPNIVTLFPFAAFFSPNLLALVIAAGLAAAAYKLSFCISKRVATVSAFIIAVLFFGAPYLLTYAQLGSPYWLLIGIAVGVLGLPAIVIVNLLVQAGNIAIGESTTPGVNIGYPDIEDGLPVLKYAGTDISIPIFPDILLAIILLLILHEGFHGLVSRAQGIELKNTGLLFASIVPLGAFVEPDEKKFKRAAPLKRLRVYAVGSFANIFVIALATFLIANAMVASGVVRGDGFVINYVVVNSSVDGLLEPGETVYSVGGSKTPTFYDFSEFMQDKKPGDRVDIVAHNRTVTVTLGPAPDDETQGFVGLGRTFDPIVGIFAPQLATSHIEPSLGASIFGLLKWIFFLNLMIGLINLLPLKPLDGGYVYDGFFDWVEESLPFGRKLHLAKIFSKGFMLLILGIFLINFLPYFL